MEVPIRCPLDEEFGYKARRELALCLDPIAPMGNDWRLLMDEMGFAYRYKHYLEQEKSPTIKLLEVWTQSAGYKATISLLKEYIGKLEPQRSDAVDIVEKYMKLSGIEYYFHFKFNMLIRSKHSAVVYYRPGGANKAWQLLGLYV